MPTITEIKKELISVNKISKITNAMKIIAISKISGAKRRFLDIVELNNALLQTAKILLADLSSEVYNTKESNSEGVDKTLWIVFTTSLGMAGSYNMNLIKNISSNIKKDDRVIVFGDRGYKILSRMLGETSILKHINLNEKDEDFVFTKYISRYIHDLYKTGEYSNVKVAYTKFKNATAMVPVTQQILPFTKEFADSIASPSLSVPAMAFTVEPSAGKVYFNLINMYLETMVYSAYLESKLCEHLSRKNAMLEASSSEEKKIQDLKMTYNKKRQEKITAEVSLLSAVL